MIRNWKIQIFIGLFLMLITITFNNINTQAYWGWGDCAPAHDMELIDVPIDEDAVITLDGEATEPFWSDPSNIDGKITIPLASKFGEAGFFRRDVDFTFIMNTEYIYILAEWKDNTTRPSGGPVDGMYFCWNINVVNFSAYFDTTMTTESMGGGDVDCWLWKCTNNPPGPGSEYQCTDDAFGTYDWHHSGEDIDDVSVAYGVETDDSYTLEVKRKLYTGHKYDVEFTQETIYKFNLGLMDDKTFGNQHAISWTFGLDLRPEEESIQDYDDDGNDEGTHPLISGLLLFSIILVSFGVVVFIFVYKILKKPSLR